MRIDEIKLYQVAMQLKAPFEASTHHAHALNHILVRIRSGDALGWGECAAPNDPYYLEETARTSWDTLTRFLVPAVLGKSYVDVPAFTSSYALVKGNTFARAGLEGAAWDLFARLHGRSLSSLLGGTRTEIFSGVSLGVEEDAALCDRIRQHLEEGYRRIKLKISPKHDVALFEMLRAQFPDTSFMADANSSYSIEQANHLKRLDAFNLTMIEQPLAWDDLFDHAALQRMLSTAICLDESIRSEVQMRGALALGSCRVVNVKPGRVGGLLAAKRIHDLCLAAGVPVWCGGMHEYGVGRASNIALASLPGFSLPGDISGSDKYFAEDVVDPPIRAIQGAIAVPSTPGIGFTVCEDRINTRSVRSETFRA